MSFVSVVGVAHFAASCNRKFIHKRMFKGVDITRNRLAISLKNFSLITFDHKVVLKAMSEAFVVVMSEDLISECLGGIRGLRHDLAGVYSSSDKRSERPIVTQPSNRRSTEEADKQQIFKI